MHQQIIDIYFVQHFQMLHFVNHYLNFRKPNFHPCKHIQTYLSEMNNMDFQDQHLSKITRYADQHGIVHFPLLGFICLLFASRHTLFNNTLLIWKTSQWQNFWLLVSFSNVSTESSPAIRRWKCKTHGCRATAKTDGGQLVSAASKDHHEHVNDDVEICHLRFTDTVKAMWSTTVKAFCC